MITQFKPPTLMEMLRDISMKESVRSKILSGTGCDKIADAKGLIVLHELGGKATYAESLAKHGLDKSKRSMLLNGYITERCDDTTRGYTNRKCIHIELTAHGKQVARNIAAKLERIRERIIKKMKESE